MELRFRERHIKVNTLITLTGLLSERSDLLIYLFISRFVHIEYIQVLEQKHIASPTRFNHLTQPHKPRNSICIYN